MSETKTHITAKEHEIMKVLWNSEKPLLISELAAQVQNIALNSLHPLVKALIKKGYIKVAGHEKVSKTYSRLYAPAVTVEEYAAITVNEIFKNSKQPMNMPSLLSCFVKNNTKDSSDEIIEEMEQFIDDYKKNNQ